MTIYCRRNATAWRPTRSGRELRALRQLKRAYRESPFLFVTERGGPITAATLRKMIARAGDEAHLGVPVHPHMLRHATGSYLANNSVNTRTIQAYLGHRNIMHRALYAARTGSISVAVAGLKGAASSALHAHGYSAEGPATQHLFPTRLSRALPVSE